MYTDYKTPEDDLAQIIENLNLAPANSIRIGGMTENFSHPTQVVVRLLPGSLPNPKWQLDQMSFVIMVVGENRASEKDTKNQIWNIYDALLGADNQLVGNNLYLQFNVTSMPNNQGYLDDSKPTYSMNIDVTLEKQVDTGNRKAL